MKESTEKVIDSYLGSIKSTLIQELSDEEAMQYIKWIKKLASDTIKDRKEKALIAEIKKCSKEEVKRIKKLKMQKKGYMAMNYPNDLKIGNIVYVNFGYGYCGEISDGHYGIVLSKIVANMYLILPLSSEPLKVMNVGLENLGLPNAEGIGEGKTSYLRFNQIRYVHYRRLEKIKGISDGIISLSPENLKFVNDKVIEFLSYSIDKLDT